MDKSILKQFLKAAMYLTASYFQQKQELHRVALSRNPGNMTLDRIENKLADKYHKNKSGRIDSNHAKYKVNFCRYADDFIVTAKLRK